ncbi:DUF262 domain-containing protein [Aureibaculum algae]|uniref:DUF262 domain-containing protein n=1 Tax=Aureibaculum algae TaxID=2584122 RepID=A0A5B7U268_9FLAO|nr:DUF262 domain-containing protein [Aureibaculum algae]QCX41097.1 DUF262 domain-containing protein [Aureibaculum algae]
MSKQDLFEKIFKEHLKVETFSKSVDSLYSMRSKSKIDFKPYYQRNYVWDDHKASYFIESILLGTEIPPLIFFNNNSGIEVIDGRQRYETILRFMNNEFSLTSKGLSILSQLKGFSWDKLIKKHPDIIDSFLDSKLRLIEFRLVNQPPLDPILQDQVKKEIFSRYNSGITPLKKAEIDNAIYNDDDLSNFFKSEYSEDEELMKMVFSNFFKQPKNQIDELPSAKIMSFTRRALVMHLYPINYFVRGTGRTNILSKLYEYYADENIENKAEILKEFKRKIIFLGEVRSFSENNNYSINRLALECFLWGYSVLDLEEITYDFANEVEQVSKFIHENIDYFTLVDYAFSHQVMSRYISTSEYFESRFNVSFNNYVTADESARKKFKEFSNESEEEIDLTLLETLRLSKPEPANNSIDDIVRTMTRRKFLLRPSYQRKEVINVNKASAIIESILLGIKLPPIFVYKRLDGVNEVIDGQQRLLTLLGFLGEDYLNEKDKLVKSKNHNFKLKKLRILKELNNSSFNDLSDEQKDKIYDFQIYVVEIDESQNPKFDPIDLFIRLNDKPYPIRENSFEMWNSWVDVEIIKSIKELKSSIDSWFYIKKIKRSKDRDRMENEELITSLCYIEYYSNSELPKTIDVYQKTSRMNSRISTKGRISTLLQSLSENEENKKHFFKSLKSVKSNIKKIKYVLIDRNVTKEEISDFLRTELNSVLNGGKVESGFRRRIQDFYFVWMMIDKVNFEMVKYHRIEMKKDISELLNFAKNIPQEFHEDGKGFSHFNKKLDEFHKRYQKADRKIKLNESEKLALIKKQNNQSSLSEAPIFLGDDIEVDHIKPISIGGNDSIENLGIAHKIENREKGVKE